jgi:uncharacterized membrane protein YbhN (UPF0104 family)
VTEQPQRKLPRAWWSVPPKDLLKIVLALVLIVFVVSRTNLQNLILLKDGLSWQWLWISLMFYSLVTLAKGLQYWTLLGVPVPFRETLKIVIIQNAMTNFVTNTAGIASYMTLFKLEQNVKLRRSGLVFLLTKAGDLLAMVFFLALSSLQVWARIPLLQETVISLLLVAGAGLVIFWAAVFMRQRFVIQFRNVLHSLRLDRLGIVQRILDMLDALVAQEHNTVVSSHLKGTALSFLYMTLTMAYSYSRFQIFPIPADFWVILFITSILQFISIIPIQIFGGLGVSELTLVYLFTLFGVTQVDIPAIVVALRVLFYLFNLAILVYLPVDALLSKLKYQESKPLSETTKPESKG